MSTVTLLLAGDVDEHALESQAASWDVPDDVELLTSYRADDDPLAATGYGARWPYGAVVSLDAPERPLDDLEPLATAIVDSLGGAVDRPASTAVAGTTHRIIDGRTGVALVFAIHRVGGTTTEQYQEHWQYRHGPLAKELVPTRGYEQLHVDLDRASRLNSALGFDDAEFDGIATCFFDTRDDFAAMLDARETNLDMNVIYEDELRFLDHGRSFGAMVRAVDPAPGPR